MRRVLIALLFCTRVIAEEPPRGRIVENVVTRADPAQSYSLYLPTTYDPVKHHPALLVFDPRGRGTFAAELFREGAEKYGWIILSSNGTRSDQGGEPNEKAVRALVPELGRYSVHPTRVYAAGFSGTAMLAWGLKLRGGALAGTIGVGGRFVEGLAPEKFAFAQYGFAGQIDFNNTEMRAIHAALEKAGKHHRFVQFEGDHRWMSSALATDAIAWLEVIAMKERKRPVDLTMVTAIFAQEIAAAQADLDAGKLTDALRRYHGMVRTYEGLVDVSEVRQLLDRVQGDPLTTRALEQEAKWDRFELDSRDAMLARSGGVFASLRQSETPVTPIRIAQEFGILDLQRQARKVGAEGLAARRLLETIHSQLSFYLFRQLYDRKEYALAAAAIGAAAELHPDDWWDWYNFGAASALAGDGRQALRALERSVASGFDKQAMLIADEDFASLRGNARFKEIVKALQAKQP